MKTIRGDMCGMVPFWPQGRSLSFRGTPRKYNGIKACFIAYTDQNFIHACGNLLRAHKQRPDEHNGHGLHAVIISPRDISSAKKFVRAPVRAQCLQARGANKTKHTVAQRSLEAHADG